MQAPPEILKTWIKHVTNDGDKSILEEIAKISIFKKLESSPFYSQGVIYIMLVWSFIL